ncbi:lysylphosphatidylglycerol synthase domain-containing protein [Streptomyces sp. NPDC005571]|uniref:lysylphosphatidylglycerol synthase domain-containing protein n=1 Tax=Streptomyces sp. NPDC005571 TaxID=3156888 RepID=UPI0033BC0A07
MPAGLGAGAVNLRFLRGCGIPLTQSSAALALYLLAEAAGRVVLLLTLLTAYPDALRLDGLVPRAVALPLAWTAVGLVCTAVVALVAIRPLRRVIGAFLGTALTDARALHARPARALALWGGSLAFPVLQAAGLVTVALALDVPVPVIHVAIAYLAASIAAAAVPTPGGIGSVDAALVVALVAAGASVTAAGSVVLGYRIITVWLPLIPGALVLGALVRSKVV